MIVLNEGKNDFFTSMVAEVKKVIIFWDVFNSHLVIVHINHGVSGRFLDDLMDKVMCVIPDIIASRSGDHCCKRLWLQ